MNTFTKRRRDANLEGDLNLPTKSHHPFLKVVFWFTIALAFTATIAAIGIVQLKSQLKIGDADLPTLKHSNTGIQFFDRTTSSYAPCAPTETDSQCHSTKFRKTCATR